MVSKFWPSSKAGASTATTPRTWASRPITNIELHEPFAATILSIFKIGKERFGHDWRAKNDAGLLNPHGGSIALGHPLGATGTRLLLNLVYAMKADPKSRLGMIAACAGGGMGGAMVVEKAG